MAYEIPGKQITLPAGADLSAKQYFFVKVNSSGEAVLAGAGEKAIGVLQNKPASGASATVMTDGVTKICQSGSLAVGSTVASDSNGKAKAAVAGAVNTGDAGAAADPALGSFAMGTILDNGGADTAYGTMIIEKMGFIPTTAS